MRDPVSDRSIYTSIYHLLYPRWTEVTIRGDDRLTAIGKIQRLKSSSRGHLAKSVLSGNPRGLAAHTMLPEPSRKLISRKLNDFKVEAKAVLGEEASRYEALKKIVKSLVREIVG